jgi:hypothetical protein
MSAALSWLVLVSVVVEPLLVRLLDFRLRLVDAARIAVLGCL